MRAANAIRTTSGWTCTPSLMSSSVTPGVRVAAATGPGARWWMPSIPLKAWVRMLAPASNAAQRLVVVGSGVADRHGHAGGAKGAHSVHPARQLRREGDLPQGAARCGQQQLDVRRRRRPQQSRIVRALVPHVQEGALQVRAQDARVGRRQRCYLPHPFGQHLTGAVTSETTNAGDAVALVQPGGRADAPLAVVEARAAAAVAVDVDEAGGQPGAVGVGDPSLVAGHTRPPAVADAGRRDPIAVEAHPSVADAPAVTTRAEWTP